MLIKLLLVMMRVGHLGVDRWRQSWPHPHPCLNDVQSQMNYSCSSILFSAPGKYKRNLFASWSSVVTNNSDIYKRFSLQIGIFPALPYRSNGNYRARISSNERTVLVGRKNDNEVRVIFDYFKKRMMPLWLFANEKDQTVSFWDSKVTITAKFSDKIGTVCRSSRTH